ncbi:MAG: endonuclease/exonuclease/phosphatase family protein [Planctomycetota bacterium]
MIRIFILFFLVPVQLTAQQENAESKSKPAPSTKNSRLVRFATFNISFHRRRAGRLKAELAKKGATKPTQIAEIIQRVRPDVILLNEFDYDESGLAVENFLKNYLEVSQGEQNPIVYPYRYLGPVNTGVASEYDFDNDGKVSLPNDAFGFGWYEGQYGMVVLSRFEIDQSRIRTFQEFLWKDMPDNLMPFDPATKAPFYNQVESEVFRLSSKSHWDVPINISGQTVHFLAAHPTPPVFDGAEDRNGRRNHDEIRMFADYITPGRADYLYDDRGTKGGLLGGEKFVVAGDMNADPNDGDSTGRAGRMLTEHPLLNHKLTPSCEGGVYFSKSQGQQNDQHSGNPAFDTGDFNDANVGNLRLDYCLPSINPDIVKSGIYWPKPGQPGSDLVFASDHRLVWVDIEVR